MLALRVVWGLCLGFGAMVTGVGLELHADGGGAATSVALVVAGVLVVPLSSVVIERFLRVTPTSD